MFKFSKRSLKNLEGVNPLLQDIVTEALSISAVDFGVIDGLRTLEEQKEYFRTGASKTMNSKHLTGCAVDLMAYVGPRASWEMPLYFKIAEAMAEAGKSSQNIISTPFTLIWGGCWANILEGDPEDLHKKYIDRKTNSGKTAFIDGPHFEIEYLSKR